MDTEEPKDHAVDIYMRYAGLGYFTNVRMTKLKLLCIVTHDPPIGNIGCELNNLHILAYTPRNEQLNSHRFEFFPWSVKLCESQETGNPGPTFTAHGTVRLSSREGLCFIMCK